MDHEWRLKHAADGDAALAEAYKAIGVSHNAVVFAAIAQAHYQAANIRTKPVSTDYGDRK